MNVLKYLTSGQRSIVISTKHLICHNFALTQGNAEKYFTDDEVGKFKVFWYQVSSVLCVPTEFSPSYSEKGDGHLEHMLLIHYSWLWYSNTDGTADCTDHLQYLYTVKIDHTDRINGSICIYSDVRSCTGSVDLFPIQVLISLGFWSDNSDAMPIFLPDLIWVVLAYIVDQHLEIVEEIAKNIKRGATWRVTLKMWLTTA